MTGLVKVPVFGVLCIGGRESPLDCLRGRMAGILAQGPAYRHAFGSETVNAAASPREDDLGNQMTC